MKATAIGGFTLLTLAVTSPVLAQGSGTFEFGAFGQATYFDKSLHLQQARGGAGAHLGVFLSRNIEIEGEGSFTPVRAREDSLVYFVPLRARLLFNFPTSEHTSILLGGGYVHNEYGHDVDASDDGATALAGVRLGLRGLPSLRLTTYLDYIPSPQNGVDDNINWGIQVGLSWMFDQEHANLGWRG